MFNIHGPLKHVSRKKLRLKLTSVVTRSSKRFSVETPGLWWGRTLDPTPSRGQKHCAATATPRASVVLLQGAPTGTKKNKKRHLKSSESESFCKSWDFEPNYTFLRFVATISRNKKIEPCGRWRPSLSSSTGWLKEIFQVEGFLSTGVKALHQWLHHVSIWPWQILIQFRAEIVWVPLWRKNRPSKPKGSRLRRSTPKWFSPAVFHDFQVLRIRFRPFLCNIAKAPYHYAIDPAVCELHRSPIVHCHPRRLMLVEM